MNIYKSLHVKSLYLCVTFFTGFLQLWFFSIGFIQLLKQVFWPKWSQNIYLLFGEVNFLKSLVWVPHQYFWIKLPIIFLTVLHFIITQLFKLICDFPPHLVLHQYSLDRAYTDGYNILMPNRFYIFYNYIQL